MVSWLMRTACFSLRYSALTGAAAFGISAARSLHIGSGRVASRAANDSADHSPRMSTTVPGHRQGFGRHGSCRITCTPSGAAGRAANRTEQPLRRFRSVVWRPCQGLPCQTLSPQPSRCCLLGGRSWPSPHGHTVPGRCPRRNHPHQRYTNRCSYRSAGCPNLTKQLC